MTGSFRGLHRTWDLREKPKERWLGPSGEAEGTVAGTFGRSRRNGGWDLREKPKERWRQKNNEILRIERI